MVVEHVPVLAEEVVAFLGLRPGGTYLDCTVGAGGHAARILAAAPEARLVGIDKDARALALARERLAAFGPRVVLVHRDFRHLRAVLEELGIPAVDGVLFDLGASTQQLLTPERGFSYAYDAPLDMRMNEEDEVTAADLVNSLAEEELAELIFKYGEEKWARRIAAFIAKRRARQPITTTGQLVEVIKAAIPAAARRRGPHPAKRTFQALRIAVNDELTSLRMGLREAVEVLKTGGRIVVISFHSLEDRIVKHFFRDLGSARAGAPGVLPGKGVLKVLTPRPVVPSEREVRANPRARSAKLRAAEKVGAGVITGEEGE